MLPDVVGTQERIGDGLQFKDMFHEQKPPSKYDRWCFPFVTVFLLNALPIGLFLFAERLPPDLGLPGEMLPWVSVATIIFVLIGGLGSLTESTSNLNLVCRLIAVFETAFVMAQYSCIVQYEKLRLHGPKGITHDKWDALYFSIITWTTTGYGDFFPNEESRWIACSEALLGTLFNGIVLAGVIFKLNLMAKTKR